MGWICGDILLVGRVIIRVTSGFRSYSLFICLFRIFLIKDIPDRSERN